MHELTLLYGVVDKVGKVVEENGLDHVDAIVIEVGEATSVIPEFLQDGYEVVHSILKLWQEQPILAHLPEGTSVVSRQRTLLAWEEQRLQTNDEEESVPRLSMIMVSNTFSSEGNHFPFDELPARTKTAELPKRILVRGMKDESHYLDADGVIYIESTDSSHHSLIHTEDKVIPCLDKVTSLAERYGDCLLRCHASYLVNPFYVRSLKRFSLTLSDGTVLPVPEKKYTAFKRMLNNWAENHRRP